MHQIIDEEIMGIALKQAAKGLSKGEVPVGCVFVKFLSPSQYSIIAKAHNQTNKTGNATMHCEIICINEMLAKQGQSYDKENVIQELVLYVTCEPCIMCAQAINFMGVKEVKFGCRNDKFGGNGSVLSIQDMLPNPYKSTPGILDNQALQIFQQFYSIGNQKLPEEMRHRRKRVKKEQTNKNENDNNNKQIIMKTMIEKTQIILNENDKEQIMMQSQNQQIL